MQLDKKTPHYLDLNAELNLPGPDGRIRFEKDHEAAKQYFLQDVNKNTVFFHNLREKIDYLIENKYWDPKTFEMYAFEDIKELFKRAYGVKFRFSSFMGAFKYYTSYTLKTFDGERYLERFEDRVCITALYLAQGDLQLATDIVDEMMSTRYQPATPTFLSAGKAQRGEMVSCFLLRMEDNMESIGRSINSALQLSKRGGGVAFNLTNLREEGAPIKHVENQCSGVQPIMKMFEDAFSYADQLGQRQGAGAAYLSIHHFDIETFLDTKRENADEKIRIKTLSLGVIVTDAAYHAMEAGDDVYQFSAYDIERVYGIPMGDLDITKHYQELINNPNIKKKRINGRVLLQTVGEIQPESGYPYIMNIDTVNRANPNPGWIGMSNLCTEILQTSTPSVFNEDGSYKVIGHDISCNLGSQNVVSMMKNAPNIGKSVEIATRALTSVSDMTSIESVPSIREGNKADHAIGLGVMNLAGFFGIEEMVYGDLESLDFTDLYFMTINYWSLKASCKIARERGVTYADFPRSKYASGEYFDYYTSREWGPRTEKVLELVKKYNWTIPSREDWIALAEEVKTYGLYNKYRLATAPTGSISYVNHSTSSAHPIAERIEVRKEGKTGRKYYPAPGLTNENAKFFPTAYETGPYAIIDVYAAATPHVDQGMSLTIFLEAPITTREVNQMQIYAWKRGIKTIYYLRVKQEALEGTEVETFGKSPAECEACAV